MLSKMLQRKTGDRYRGIQRGRSSSRLSVGSCTSVGRGGQRRASEHKSTSTEGKKSVNNSAVIVHSHNSNTPEAERSDTSKVESREDVLSDGSSASDNEKFPMNQKEIKIAYELKARLVRKLQEQNTKLKEEIAYNNKIAVSKYTGDYSEMSKTNLIRMLRLYERQAVKAEGKLRQNESELKEAQALVQRYHNLYAAEKMHRSSSRAKKSKTLGDKGSKPLLEDKGVTKASSSLTTGTPKVLKCDIDKKGKGGLRQKSDNVNKLPVDEPEASVQVSAAEEGGDSTAMVCIVVVEDLQASHQEAAPIQSASEEFGDRNEENDPERNAEKEDPVDEGPSLLDVNSQNGHQTLDTESQASASKTECEKAEVDGITEVDKQHSTVTETAVPSVIDYQEENKDPEIHRNATVGTEVKLTETASAEVIAESLEIVQKPVVALMPKSTGKQDKELADRAKKRIAPVVEARNHDVGKGRRIGSLEPRQPTFLKKKLDVPDTESAAAKRLALKKKKAEEPASEVKAPESPAQPVTEEDIRDPNKPKEVNPCRMTDDDIDDGGGDPNTLSDTPQLSLPCGRFQDNFRRFEMPSSSSPFGYSSFKPSVLPDNLRNSPYHENMLKTPLITRARSVLMDNRSTLPIPPPMTRPLKDAAGGVIQNALNRENSILKHEVSRLRNEIDRITRILKETKEENEMLMHNVHTSEHARAELLKRLEKEKIEHGRLEKALTKQVATSIRVRREQQEYDEVRKWGMLMNERVKGMTDKLPNNTSGMMKKRPQRVIDYD